MMNFIDELLADYLSYLIFELVILWPRDLVT